MPRKNIKETPEKEENLKKKTVSKINLKENSTKKFKELNENLAKIKKGNSKVENNKKENKLQSKVTASKKQSLNNKLPNKKDKVAKKANSNEKIDKKSTVETENNFVEYYDLPYRYNETVVKILAQTPRRLFVYWEVSEKDKETYKNAFGEDFFEKTYPVLLVYNEQMNYTFEVPINDFANSWYLDIKDPKTKYVVKLGRKFRNIADIRENKEIIKEEHINLQNDFIYITDSNKLEAPNDHVLFEKLPSKIIYRNVKNGNETNKDTNQILDKIAENYKEANIKDVYYTLYGEEISEEILNNPTSGGLSSSSSNFRTNRNTIK